MPKLSDILTQYKEQLGDEGFKAISEAVDTYKTEFTNKHIAKLERLETRNKELSEVANKWESQELKANWIAKGYSEDKFDEAKEIYGSKLTADQLEEVAKSDYWKAEAITTPKGDVTGKKTTTEIIDDPKDDNLPIGNINGYSDTE